MSQVSVNLYAEYFLKDFAAKSFINIIKKKIDRCNGPK